MNEFRCRHFRGDIILCCVRWYGKYGISYRDLEEMMKERGVEVDHTTLYRWVQCYAPKMMKKLKYFWNPSLGQSWHVEQLGDYQGVMRKEHERGTREKSETIAINLLEQGIKPTVIRDATGFSLKEIDMLKKRSSKR